MKTKRFWLLGGLFAAGLFAQSPANPPVTAPAVGPATIPPEPLSVATLDRIDRMTPLFDGKTLDGWIQAPSYATTFSGEDNQGLFDEFKDVRVEVNPIENKLITVE